MTFIRSFNFSDSNIDIGHDIVGYIWLHSLTEKTVQRKCLMVCFLLTHKTIFSMLMVEKTMFYIFT